MSKFLRSLRLPTAWSDRIAYGLIALVSLIYFVGAVRTATESPYWMDEVLAVWTARLPTARAVWDALARGAEFSPPLYHLLLQKIVQLGGHGRLWMRLPSILAVYGVAWCAFVLVRRRQPAMIAALALTLCLASGLAVYAVQARPYALVAAGFALAVVLWDGIAGRAKAWPSAVGIGVCLAAAIGLHFYAILLAAALGLAELAWTLNHRRIRWPVLAAIALAGLSILLWLPILRQASAFNRGDTTAAYYYAHPTALKLGAAYVGDLAGHASILCSPLLVLSVTAVAAFVLSLRTPWRIGNLAPVVVAACLIPLIVFAFAVVVTHTFNERYTIACVLGFALLLARCAAALPYSRWAALGLALVLAIGMLSPPRNAFLADDLRGDTALVLRAPKDLPIVTGNGLRFLELSENTDPATAARLIYLTAPSEDQLGDPTNEHQVARWKTIDPRLDIQPAAPWLAAHKRFLLFRDPDAAAEAPSLFDADDAKVEEIGKFSSATLSRVQLAN